MSVAPVPETDVKKRVSAVMKYEKGLLVPLTAPPEVFRDIVKALDRIAQSEGESVES